MFKNFFNFTWELLKIVIISLVIIFPIRYFLIQPFYVKGASMEPSFYDHEYLIVDEISYRFDNPKRGDIIVFRYPKNPQEFFIKRIIGLPGEKVQVKDGRIYIYNELNPGGLLLEEDYLEPGIKTHSMTEEIIELDKNEDVKSKNEYFVMGDNRNASKDSRSFGPVKESFLIGRVFFRGWPFDRINVFKAPEYKPN